MATAASIIAQGLGLAGNPSLSTTDALNWLNNALQAEYRRKYPWQRVTVTIPVVAGTTSYPGSWDTRFLDTYQQQDGSCGRYVRDNAVAKLWEWDYRSYIVQSDRLSAAGAPNRIVADQVGATWYIFPVPDAAYTVTVDIYQLPALLALSDIPLWSSYAPDEILVQMVKVAALMWMDDQRYVGEAAMLYGDVKQQIPGMLPTYRRRVQLEEGTTHQSALDPRVFLPMPPAD